MRSEVRADAVERERPFSRPENTREVSAELIALVCRLGGPLLGGAAAFERAFVRNVS